MHNVASVALMMSLVPLAQAGVDAGPRLPGARESRTVSLPAVVKMAVANNPVLAAAHAEVVSSSGAVQRSAGIDDFVGVLNGTWSRARRPFALVPGTVQQLRADDLRLQAGLERALPTGGKLAFRPSFAQIGSEFAADFGAGRQGGSAHLVEPGISLAFDQPLLQGAGVRVARAERRASAVKSSLAQAQYRGVARRVLLDLLIAYWEVYRAREQLKIREQSVAATRDHLAFVVAESEVGKRPRSGSAEVGVALALREEATLIAELGVQQRSRELQAITGTPPAGEDVLWTPDGEPPTFAEELSAAQAIELATTRNTDLEVLRHHQKLATIEWEVAENSLRPRVDLTSTAGRSNQTEAVTADTFGSLPGYSVQIGLTVRHSFGRNEGHGRWQQARSDLDAIRYRQADVTTKVRLAILRLESSRSVCRQREPILQKAVTLASLDLEAERARYAVGRASSFDVLRRQESIEATRLRALSVHVDCALVGAELSAVAGGLLGELSVVLR